MRIVGLFAIALVGCEISVSLPEQTEPSTADCVPEMSERYAELDAKRRTGMTVEEYSEWKDLYRAWIDEASQSCGTEFYNHLDD